MLIKKQNNQYQIYLKFTMKTFIKFTGLLVIVALTILSCSKNDDRDPEVPAQYRNTFINYSVAGNQINGTFNIVLESILPLPSNLATQLLANEELIFPDAINPPSGV